MSIVIAVDGLGGDLAPDAVVEGMRLSKQRNRDIRFILVGPVDQMQDALGSDAELVSVVSFVDAPDKVGMEDKPSQALRHGKQTSLWRAIEEVKEGRAMGVVSGGNTGAMMAMAKLQLRMIDGFDRPAIAAIWPTLRAESVVLDVGANIDATASQLTQFTLMGVEFARLGLGIMKPTVGLLNIGSEDLKGRDELRDAQSLLIDCAGDNFHYHGFVEGNDIGKGIVDVVVTDGFTGNIALKSAEGTAQQVGAYLRAALSSSWGGKLGYFFARGSLRAFRNRVDPRRVNGGPLLGLNGLVVKSHGGSDALGFASALDLAIDLSRGDIVNKLAKQVIGLSQQAANTQERLKT
ncbi:MAG: phosphate acyltransferase PlsX [Alphaproteobacteria bacterium]|jgi:glycerol-3-phosphate acyltransferase PlsX